MPFGTHRKAIARERQWNGTLGSISGERPHHLSFGKVDTRVKYGERLFCQIAKQCGGVAKHSWMYGPGIVRSDLGLIVGEIDRPESILVQGKRGAAGRNCSDSSQDQEQEASGATRRLLRVLVSVLHAVGY